MHNNTAIKETQFGFVCVLFLQTLLVRIYIKKLSLFVLQDFNLWRRLSDDIKRLIPLKKEFIPYVSQELGACHARCAGPRGDEQEAETGGRRRHRPEPMLEFHGKAKAGGGAHLGLAGLNNSGQLWAVFLVSGCLVHGPGMTQGRGNTSLASES